MYLNNVLHSDHVLLTISFFFTRLVQAMNNFPRKLKLYPMCLEIILLLLPVEFDKAFLKGHFLEMKELEDIQTVLCYKANNMGV